MEQNVSVLPVAQIIEEEAIKRLLPNPEITAMMALARISPEEIAEKQRDDYLKLFNEGIVTFLTLFTKRYGKSTPTGVELQMTADDNSVIEMAVDDNGVTSSIHVVLTRNKPLVVLSDRIPGEERALLGREGKWLLAIRQAAIQNQRIAEAAERRARVAQQTRIADEMMEDI